MPAESANTLTPFVTIVTPLTVALGLALAVERGLELLRHFLESFLRSGITALIDSKKTEQQVKAVETAVAELDRSIEQIDTIPKQQTAQDEADGDSDWEDRHTLSTVMVKSATDPDDGTTLKALLIQLFGFALGIITATVADLQLFNIFMAPIQKAVHLTLPVSIDHIFSGLVIGGGSKYVHLLIRLITRRRFKPTEDVAPDQVAAAKEPRADEVLTAAPTPLVSVDPSEWIDIAYDGGVDRQLLANRHRRSKDPDLIVFHHTAMHSDSTFQDVVQTIKKKNWSTGYHCVILKDGSIHPFCRWDRYGCHAKGHNLTSLGISFNGNFELNTGAGNNANGRFGLKTPSEAQVKSGARIVALWVSLYKDIQLDFDQSIQPHHKLKSTVCPGSGFPTQAFQKWVEYFVLQWQKSSVAQAKLDIFKSKPYLYI